EHDGIHRFTVGQRKNLGVSAGKRLYVVRVDRDGTVELGPRERLLADSAYLTDVAIADGVTAPFSCHAVVRYRGTPLPARLEHGPEGYRLDFVEPLHAVVPGQVAVMYDGDRVLGGGTILRSWLRSGTSACSPVVNARA
ncbi:MAG: tRNA 2-thiouridine(34) synthase MnmA, partial [Myxococcales bacterium]|nr:tRNA 2-thiouridine(34) synthase MnmA [Myxococcales bacterium]